MTDETTKAVEEVLTPINRAFAHALLTGADLLCFGSEAREHSELCDVIGLTLQAKDRALEILDNRLTSIRSALSTWRAGDTVGESLAGAIERALDGGA